jgi:site-specific DNA-methyltransferase (adenine-specific)
MNIETGVIHYGDSLSEMKELEDNSVDMVITSPPYAERRKKAYGGIPESHYVQWFKPFAEEIYRILKPTGSFFLNIKPHVHNGERSLYVMDLVLMLKRSLGFHYIDEFSWTKNGFPGGYKGRFKNGFEPVYHFTKGKFNEITFNPLACGTPVKEGTKARALRKQCGDPKNGSEMTAINGENLLKLELARPSNVIHVNNVSNQFGSRQNHPAPFPVGLVDFFIKSFSNEGDIILDPFAGGGTTGESAKNNNRKFYLIDNVEKYVELMEKELKIERS